VGFDILVYPTVKNKNFWNIQQTKTKNKITLPNKLTSKNTFERAYESHILKIKIFRKYIVNLIKINNHARSIIL